MSPVRARLNGIALVAAACAAVVLLAGCGPYRRDMVWQRSGDVGVCQPDVYARSAPAHVIWLETLAAGAVEQEWGTAGIARSVDGHKICIAGHSFRHGIGTHARSDFEVDLKGQAVAFHSAAGLDDEVGGEGSVVFRVLVDDDEVLRTGVLRKGDQPVLLSVDLRGAETLRLVVENGDDSIDYDHADWAGAMIELVPDAISAPAAMVNPPEATPLIAAAQSEVLAINAPRITGATPGRPFLFRIPATGERPLRFSAGNLPGGLVLDADTGIITGSLQTVGRTEVALAVEGLGGRAASTLTIVGGPDALALTPPMGWNSWNVWGTAVDDAKVRAAADRLVESGLADVGYQYVNIDDAWEGLRDAEGRIQPNEKFPDMKALADYVHAKGLKLGIYSSPGPKTCAGYEASYLHEDLDAQQWADWGIDLVKYDWCSYGGIAPEPDVEAMRKPYDVMRASLDKVGRDIVYSLCQYGMGEVWTWGESVGGNLWRTTGDITDTWASLSTIGFGQAGHESYAGPGHWNDPDMLILGMVGWGPNLHPTRLTPNEQLTHMTLWSLLAAPLLIGCDLTQLDEYTLGLLANREVIEVNQDLLGAQAHRVLTQVQLEVWARPLADGSWAVGLFNRGRKEGTVSVAWAALDIQHEVCAVRNLWLRADEGEFAESYTATIPRHGAVFIKVTPIIPPPATGRGR